MSGSISVAEVKKGFPEQLDPLLGCNVCKVIALFVVWADVTCSYHVCGRMSLDFTDGDGCGPLGLDLLVVVVP